VLDTVLSPWTTLCKLAGTERVLAAMREHPGFLRPGLEAVARSLANYVKFAVESGIHGIWLVVDSASHNVLTPKEYAEWSLPYDRLLLETAQAAPCNAIYAEGARLHLDSVLSLPAALLGWSQHGGPSLQRMKSRWKGLIIGGLDERALTGQDPGHLGRQVEELWLEMGPTGWILAPGGDLPTDVPPYALDHLRRAAESIARLKEPSETRYSAGSARPRRTEAHAPVSQPEPSPRKPRTVIRIKDGESTKLEPPS
jgi:uroporphyrinogen-III decarboxylase